MHTFFILILFTSTRASPQHFRELPRARARSEPELRAFPSLSRLISPRPASLVHEEVGGVVLVAVACEVGLGRARVLEAERGEARDGRFGLGRQRCERRVELLGGERR